jgi:inosose dehydratase
LSIRLGINPLTWSNDDLPALGADIDLDTCLREAAEAGYAGVELGHKFPRTADVLRPLLERYGLALVSGWYSLQLCERDVDTELRAMQPHLDLLAGLDCEVVIVAEVSGAVHGDPARRASERPSIARGHYGRFAERLSQLAERVRACGLHLAYHHHVGTVVQTAEDVDELMRSTPPEVELLLDTGHLTFAGADPAAVAARYATRIAHVHCKDVRPSVLRRCVNRDSSFLEAVLQGVFTVPGDGCVNYEAVLDPLVAAGYSGWLVVEAEQDPAVADPRTYAGMGFRHLSTLSRRLFQTP